MWRLLTTLTVKNFDEAVRCVKYYATRWGIEEFHRILKTGCRVEYMAYKDIDRITRALAVYMVVVCRLMLLLKLGREMPDLPPEALFDDVEITVLRTLSEEGKKNLNNLHDAVVMVAKLGGIWVVIAIQILGTKFFGRATMLYSICATMKGFDDEKQNECDYKQRKSLFS